MWVNISGAVTSRERPDLDGRNAGLDTDQSKPSVESGRLAPGSAVLFRTLLKKTGPREPTGARQLIGGIFEEVKNSGGKRCWSRAAFRLANRATLRLSPSWRRPER